MGSGPFIIVQLHDLQPSLSLIPSHHHLFLASGFLAHDCARRTNAGQILAEGKGKEVLCKRDTGGLGDGAKASNLHIPLPPPAHHHGII